MAHAECPSGRDLSFGDRSRTPYAAFVSVAAFPSNALNLACLAAFLGCAGDRVPPDRTPPAPSPFSAASVTPATPTPSAIVSAPAGTASAPAAIASAPSTRTKAAVALARTFSADIFGVLAPLVPVAGTYVMSIEVTFQTFVTTEMRIDDHRTGALRMAFDADGSAHACLGSRGTQVVDGQYRYEPPGKRRHSATEDARLLALAGTWALVDDVAHVRFDRIEWGTCEVASTTRLAAPYVALRCIGVGASDRVPAAGLACEASGASDLLGLGMPMSDALRAKDDERMRQAPAGPHLLLGAPGLSVAVSQDSHAIHPTFTLRAGAAPLVEAEYRRVKP